MHRWCIKQGFLLLREKLLYRQALHKVTIPNNHQAIQNGIYAIIKFISWRELHPRIPQDARCSSANSRSERADTPGR